MEENLATIVSKIVEATGKEEEEILKMIEEKEKEFEGLVSTLGAAYIVAKEQGVKLNDMRTKEVKIKDLFAGLGGVRIKAKILKVFPVNEFNRRDGSKGRVMNVLLGDETGVIRMSLWDEQVDNFKFDEGDVIEIEKAYVKEGYNNNNELRLVSVDNVEKCDKDIEVSEDIEGISYNLSPLTAKEVIMFKEGDRVEADGYVVRLFAKSPVYKYCPMCRAKLEEDYCAVHGKVTPEVLVIISGIFDDGSSAIVFNMFRETAERFLGMSWKEIEEKINNNGLNGFYESLNIEGKRYRFRGVVKRSDYSSSLEFNVNSFKELSAVDYINKMIREVNS